MSLATRLRDLRLRKSQSLQDVADEIRVSKTHIWELEKGRSQNPSVEMLTKLADHFEVTIRFLVGEELDSGGGDEQLMRMFRQVGELGEADRAFLDDMIKAMRKRRRSGDAPD